MTRAALIDALRRKAREDAEAIWQAARAEAEKCRLDAARATEEERSARLQELAGTMQRLESAATAEAGRDARAIRMRAAAALAERLHRLARATLPQFAAEGQERLFTALAGELPAREWRSVRVRPADEKLAREHFPRAEIVCDEAVAGGLEVEADAGRIRVSNTLETRLDVAWPDLLPALIASLSAEAPENGTAA